MIDNKLEQYYLGDDEWEQFISYYINISNTSHTLQLASSLNGDITLAKTIEGIVGNTSLDWIKRKIPALDNISPIECLNNKNLLMRLRSMLMRM